MDLKAVTVCVLLEWTVTVADCAAITGQYAGGCNESNLASSD